MRVLSRLRSLRLPAAVLLLTAAGAGLAVACGSSGTPGAGSEEGGSDTGSGSDGTTSDSATSTDAPAQDVTTVESGATDSGAHDAGAADASPSDAASDALADAEGGALACTPDAGLAPYEDFTSPANWTFFDLATLPTAASLAGLLGTQFDGRYVYMISANGAASVRFDTHGSFTDPNAWSTFDTTAISGSQVDFSGSQFDGRNLYFVPSSFSNSIGLRFDTTTAFDGGGVWSVFDTAGASAAGTAKGFAGAVLDGRYVYYVPSYNGASDGVTARYDTLAPFDAGSSWTTFDTSSVNGSARGFGGGVFDGRYVYFEPADFTATARYDTDTDAGFASAASWSTFDVGALDAGTKNFDGAGFDGRYVYFAPQGNTVAVRYDTHAAFGSPAAWSALDIAAASGGAGVNFQFSGTAFDGRFMYFLPFSGGRFVRYDTTQPFLLSCAWSGFDVTTLSAGAAAYESAVFDGQYIYFVPALDGAHVVVSRLQARNPPAMPNLPGFHGSFR